MADAFTGIFNTAAALATDSYNSQQQGQANWQTFLNNLYLQNQAQNWQKMMSDTSHQREVEDLKKAGLNPILSANAGANAYGTGLNSAEAHATQSQAVQLKIALRNQDMQERNSEFENNLKLEQADLTKAQQETEVTQQNLNNSINALNVAKKIESETKLPWEVKKTAQEIAESATRAINLNANTAETRARTDLVKEEIKATRANTANALSENEIKREQLYNNMLENKKLEYENKMRPIKDSFSMVKDIGIGAGAIMGGSKFLPVKHNPVGFK